MIISPTWKTDVLDTDDGLVIRHDVDNTSVAEQAKFIRENTDRGFTTDRQMQLVGYIPFDQFVAEGLHKKPMSETMKWLESDKATPFRGSRRNTGQSGNIIIYWNY